MDSSSSSTSRFIAAPRAEAAGEDLPCLEGNLEAVTFRNEENGFTIARLNTFDKEQVTIIGAFANPIPGEALQVWGKWETHRQYGRQFRIERYRLLKPTNPDALEKFLGGGMIKGIGTSIAQKLVAFFGVDTIEVIENSPERLTEAPGIGRKKAKAIVKGWDEHKEVRHIMLFLQGQGISATYAMKIYKEYGEQAIEIVTKNPYQLARDVFGIGFKKADGIAGQMGFAHDAPERIEAGVLHCLRQAADQGHCFLPEEELVKGAAEILSGGDDGPAENAPTLDAARAAIERMIQLQYLIRDTDDPARTPIYLKSMFIRELNLAHGLGRLAGLPMNRSSIPADLPKFVRDICGSLKIELAPEQTRAVIESLRSRVLVLTGGPGTGKTTTTRAILQAHLQCGRKVALASPTGRAAKRLAEVTGQQAQTLHRLLEVDPKTFTFKRDAENPLECETLIVDEFSMVDLNLAYSLVRALPDKAQLILVGDADQLPSVSAGNVLRDVIASGRAPVVRLTEIFRQAAESTIITNAHRVNHGEMPTLVPTRRWQTADCLFIPQDDPLAAARKVCDVVCRSLPALGYTSEQVQVLTPMQRGTLGAVYLNEMLQQALNPRQFGVAEHTRGQKTLRCGDRVIQTVNNYDLEVFNGDIGYLAHIDKEKQVLVVRYPEREVTYPFDTTEELQLAYALTVHKAQGSEYPAAEVVMHTQHYLLLQRNLLYTALTRAKKLVILLGSQRAVGIAVRSQNRLERYTRLEARLRE